MSTKTVCQKIVAKALSYGEYHINVVVENDMNFFKIRLMGLK